MASLFIFGMGYCATRIARALVAQGWTVTGTQRDAGPDTVAFGDEPRVLAALGHATHILSSVPPEGESDPVLARYGAAIAASGARWTCYLSSTGVYGDSGGAWVDESAPVGAGRRSARAAADAAWLALRSDVRVFRLPGIYGPGRSALDRVGAGKAHRIDLPCQVFSRIHVDDIVAGVIAGFDGPAGAYNLADDLPAPQNAVIEEACALLGLACPPMLPLENAGLSAAQRAFYGENRRVANGKAKRLLGWKPLYPDYRAGLRALSAITSPAKASAQPTAASNDQR
ncbi:SDR family NAD(P)-dependent oxidoreductase [Sphingomonas cavernae]|uniref:SDR family NAD(P)-dependent oxidoreductase n=1 Tax=Sphingomonas cavernae TaxID=2320861 RepID=A0A418WRY2_9SPHN|nr:SDR family NAD(P)-dependent oxidoreductase [Sphingomonas cavernae]RJF94020.1 SDR family NAD(P)-dependent oxidoreductase [Sphingomonas cavernae]